MASRILSSRLRSHLAPLLRSAACPPLLHWSSSPPPPRHILFRDLSTAAAARRRPSRVDIGARARQLQSRRLWTYALTFSCVAGFIVIVLSTFQDQLVFYVTPTDALAKFASDPSNSKFRLGGLVVEGSVIHPSPLSPEMEFVVTDLITDILVRYDGSLPDLFREGHSVVVEGFVRPISEVAAAASGGGGVVVSQKARSSGCFFKATEVLAKHDEKYMPQEVAAAIEQNKKKLEAEGGIEAHINKEK